MSNERTIQDKSEAIAKQLDMSVDTIYTHLLKLHEMGYEVELDKLISQKEIQDIRHALATTPREDNRLKPVFEALNGEFSYGKIKLVETLSL